MLGFTSKASLAAVLAGAVAGIATASASGHVQDGWVAAGVLVVLAVVILIGLIRRLATTYTITNRRLTIDVGLLSRDLHQTRLERVQNVNTRQIAARADAAHRQRRLRHRRRVGVRLHVSRASRDPHGIVRTVDRALHELQQTGAGL